eukprot:gnl/MRDRNA2_/MRDRNA2_178436_c0_seq1.p1 gnl/MRDRNA2_/MRDRNA2_178436_c0~~gnl/MRDRNA2_/MRDRNA2_178436_c0_seq1.p1  ORF type:complete len:535 (-),score=51.73 gnl/MRDRNA2_/MRDRNA2_178436_c0_seq1:20-1402(-)
MAELQARKDLAYCPANFTSFRDLPYCSRSSDVDQNKMRGAVQLECVALHNWQFPGGCTGDDNLFMPSKIMSLDRPGIVPKPALLIADLERFEIVIDHAFESDRNLGIAGSSRDVQGLWVKRALGTGLLGMTTTDSAFAIPCEGVHCSGQSVEHVQEIPSARSTYLGDIISVADLVKLADATSASGMEVLDGLRRDGKSLRHAGGVIVITLEYDNRLAWTPLGTRKLVYKYVPSLFDLSSYNKIYSKWAWPTGTEGAVEVNGLQIVVNFRGRLLGFDFFNLLLLLAASAALLLATRFLVDFLSCYIAKLRGKYYVLKYQPTLEFSRYEKRMKRALDTHGAEFNPRLHKLDFAEQLLLDCAQDGHAKRLLENEGNELLGYLLTLERRLNCLDAKDEHFLGLHDAHVDGFNPIDDPMLKVLQTRRSRFDTGTSQRLREEAAEAARRGCERELQYCLVDTVSHL